jgi:hypothetical protein
MSEEDGCGPILVRGGRHKYSPFEEDLMPLRDHFYPPISKRSSWEGFHAGWPSVIVRQLASKLPDQYVAEPWLRLGDHYEIDVIAHHEETGRDIPRYLAPEPGGSVATAAPPLPPPTLTVDVDFPEQYSYEVLVFDLERERRLVAAIELVSPANKDRPESRRLFAAKCFQLLS